MNCVYLGTKGASLSLAKTTQQLKICWTTTSLKLKHPRISIFPKEWKATFFLRVAEALETVQRKTTTIIKYTTNYTVYCEAYWGSTYPVYWEMTTHRVQIFIYRKKKIYLYTERKSNDGRIFSFSEKYKMMILYLQGEGRQIQPRNKMQIWLNTVPA